MSAIDQLIPALKAALPGIQVRQLQATLPGDDTGLWFVSHPDSRAEVNVESHNGELPFLIESSLNDDRVTTVDLGETIAAVRLALGLDPVGDLSDANSFSLDEGHLRAWIEQQSIHIIARESPSNDPVELSAKSARSLAQALIKMAEQLHN